MIDNEFREYPTIGIDRIGKNSFSVSFLGYDGDRYNVECHYDEEDKDFILSAYLRNVYKNPEIVYFPIYTPNKFRDKLLKSARIHLHRYLKKINYQH